MSTAILTTITVYILIGGLSAALTDALYRRQLVEASLVAAAEFGAIHITLVMSAWKVAAEEAPYPVVSPLLTAACDAPAWAAIVFLTTGIVLAAIQQHRRKAAEKKLLEAQKMRFEKKLLEAQMRSFGVNEGDESEKD